MTTTVDPIVALDDETIATVRRLADLAISRGTIEEEEGELKARLRKVLVAGQVGVDKLGHTLVRLQANRRFDLDQAVSYLDPTLAEQCRTVTYDPKQVKKYLAPAVTELCMVEVGEAKVILVTR
jgi:hypothetical protein